MSGIFIRGNPYDLSFPGGNFYFAAKDKEGRYYYLTEPLPDEENANIVFSSINYRNILNRLVTVSKKMIFII